MKTFKFLMLVIATVFIHIAAQAMPGIAPGCNLDKISEVNSGKFGHEIWPWAIAKPFPWYSVQGVWTTIDNGNNNPKLFFTFKVTRSTDKIKQLSVEIHEGNTCKRAAMRGVGIMSTYDKNVVRVNMNNILLKMALFDTSDLQLDRLSCGYKAIGATFYDLSENIETSRYRVSVSNDINDIIENPNVLLKKISSSTTYNKCNKN